MLLQLDAGRAGRQEKGSSNPCLNHGYVFARFSSGLRTFLHRVHRRDLNMQDQIEPLTSWAKIKEPCRGSPGGPSCSVRPSRENCIIDQRFTKTRSPRIPSLPHNPQLNQRKAKKRAAINAWLRCTELRYV